MLRLNGLKNPKGEWFRCTVDQVKAAIIAVREGQLNEENRSLDFKMRPEQEAAVEKTAGLFNRLANGKGRPKQGAALSVEREDAIRQDLCRVSTGQDDGLEKIFVLTFKPAVVSMPGRMICSGTSTLRGGSLSPATGSLTYEDANIKKPIACFGTFQDYCAGTERGGIKAKNEWVHETEWDCVILDEYHYGAGAKTRRGCLRRRRRKRAKSGRSDQG